MSDRPRALGGHPALAKVEVPRGEITAYHVEFARSKRALGIGWQNIAKMLGVNAVTLERVADRQEVAPAPPRPAKRPARRLEPARLVEPGLIRPGSIRHRVLAALARGVGGEPRYVAQALAHDAYSVGTAFSRLRDLGLLSQARPHGINELTETGRVELARLEEVGGE